jgi:uncharacterized protein DUF6438
VKARLVLVILSLAAATATAKPRRFVVSLERTMCFGACPAYVVSLYSDGSVEWRGKSSVGTKGEAHGKVDAKKVQELEQAFMKARFFEMNQLGEIPEPLPPGSIAKHISSCTDTSHAILTFTRGRKTRKLDDPHCSGANALTALETLVDETAETKAWIEPSPQ